MRRLLASNPIPDVSGFSLLRHGNLICSRDMVPDSRFDSAAPIHYIVGIHLQIGLPNGRHGQDRVAL